MHYKFFSVQDFVQDEFFQQWVFTPNEENERYWTSFLTHYPEQSRNVSDAREFLLTMNFAREVPGALLDRIKMDFNRAIDQYEEVGARGDGNKNDDSFRGRPGRFTFFTYSIAACFILLTAFAGYLLVRDDGTLNILEALMLHEERTPKGEQRRVVLDDGTVVWLNVNSSLRYAESFQAESLREVYLDGEAFFEVSENPEKPFIVHASGLSIKVLGTAFNVRSYTADPVVETTLVTGKVTITPAGDDPASIVTLLPNQQALFDKSSKKIELAAAVDHETFTGWKNGLMVFDNMSFAHIIGTLERWYGVTITMDDEQSLSCTFSARFKDKTLKEVLEIFKTTEAINYQIDGDKVYITGKLCQYDNSN